MRRRRGHLTRQPCVCRAFVTGGIHLNFVRDEEDETILLDVTCPSGFPKRTGFSETLVPKLQKEAHWVAEENEDRTTIIIRTTNPPAEHRYVQVKYCHRCRIRCMKYEGAG